MFKIRAWLRTLAYPKFERSGESSGSATDDASLALNELHEACLEAARTRPASAMLSLVLADMYEVIKRLKSAGSTGGKRGGGGGGGGGGSGVKRSGGAGGNHPGMMDASNQQSEFAKCFMKSSSHLVEQLRMLTTKRLDPEPTVPLGVYNLQQVYFALLRVFPDMMSQATKELSGASVEGRLLHLTKKGHSWNHEDVNMLPVLGRVADHMRDSVNPVLPRATSVIHHFMAVSLLRIFMSYVSVSKPVWVKIVALLQHDESEAAPLKSLFVEAGNICTDFIEHPELFLLAGSQLPTLKVVLGASLKGDAKADYIKRVHIVAALAENHFAPAAVKVLDASKATGGRGGGGGGGGGGGAGKGTGHSKGKGTGGAGKGETQVFKRHGGGGGGAPELAADGTEIIEDDSASDGDMSGSGSCDSSASSDAEAPSHATTNKAALKRTAAEVHRAFTAAIAQRKSTKGAAADDEDDPFSDSEPRPKAKKAKFEPAAVAAKAGGGGEDDGDESADD